MDENPSKLFKNSKFSKNIKSLFTSEFTQFYDKDRLNFKLKKIINKEKSLNNRNIKGFNYGKVFHFFKVDMRKFEEEQNKKKDFYKTLYEENQRFKSDYKKGYLSRINGGDSNSETINIKSKTFQKFYDKHKIKLEEKIKKENNLFNKDPLLESNNDINLYYMNKNVNTDNIYDDKSMIYINKLEGNINQNSILNKIKNITSKNSKKANNNKNRLKLNIDNDDISSNTDKNKTKSKKNKFKNNILNRNTIMGSKRPNQTLPGLTSNWTDFPGYKSKNSNKIFNLKSGINKTGYNYKKTKIFISPNQIKNIYNEIIRIKKNVKTFEKNNEKELKFYYTIFANKEPKKLKMSSDENKKIFKMDRNLVYTVNSFND